MRIHSTSNQQKINASEVGDVNGWREIAKYILALVWVTLLQEKLNNHTTKYIDFLSQAEWERSISGIKLKTFTDKFVPN